MNRYLNLLDFTLYSPLRRKWKVLSLVFLFSYLVFLFSSVLLPTGAIRNEAKKGVSALPDITLQKLSGGRQMPIPASYSPPSWGASSRLPWWSGKKPRAFRLSLLPGLLEVLKRKGPAVELAAGGLQKRALHFSMALWGLFVLVPSFTIAWYEIRSGGGTCSAERIGPDECRTFRAGELSANSHRSANDDPMSTLIPATLHGQM